MFPPALQYPLPYSKQPNILVYASSLILGDAEMTRRNMDKQTLVNAVYCAVLSSPKPVTRHEICTLIQRRKSPHIITIIEDLVRGGWFLRDTITDAQFGEAFVYRAGRVPEGWSETVQTLDTVQTEA